MYVIAVSQRASSLLLRSTIDRHIRVANSTFSVTMLSRVTNNDENFKPDSFYGLVDLLSKLVREGCRDEIDALLEAHPKHAASLRQLLPSLELLCDVVKETHNSSEIIAGPDVAVDYETGVLGDYRLVREIGRGGMGVVFEATQISLDRRIALKVLPFGAVLNPNQLQRFKNEARSAAGLQHPNIVPVFAVGCERGIHFFAMQFIEGTSLAEFIHQARESNIRPNWRTVCQWGIQIAEALQYAHSVGVIHRDIKPANLIVEPGGKIWFTDFGLAQFESESALTMTGDILGTLRYISPEQAEGSKGGVNNRADIYSLGASLYELATLEPMFADAERIDLLRCAKQVEPIAPRQIDSKIPIELETIILKTIEKEPGSRYATARELADDLQRFLDQRPIRARRAGWVDRLAKWSRRNVASARAILAVVILSTLALAVAVFAVQRDRRLAVETLNKNVQRQLNEHHYVTQINMADRLLRECNSKGALANLQQFDPKPGEEDLRGFEWYYLWQRSQEVAPLLGKHDGDAYCVQPSPDGELLASCGQDGIRIWKLSTGEPLQHLRAHAADVNCVSFSADGTMLASAGDDGLVCIWSTKDWHVEATFKHAGPVVAARFFPDGQKIAIAERHNGSNPKEWIGEDVVHTWDLQSGKQAERLQRHDDLIQSLAISSDGKLVATGSSDGTAIVWDVDKVTAGSGGIVRVWAPHDGHLMFSLLGADQTIESIAVNSDGSEYAAVGADKFFFSWQSGAETGLDIINTPIELWCVAYGGSHVVFIADRNGSIHRWDTRRPGNRLRIPIKTSYSPRIAFNGNNLITATLGTEVHEYQLPDGNKFESSPTAALDSSPISTFIDRDGTSIVLSITNGQLNKSGLVCQAVSHDGAHIAASYQDGMVYILNAQTGLTEFQLLPNPRHIDHLAFSRDGRTLAGIARNNTLHLWHVATGRELLSLPTGCRDYRDLCFAPDDSALVVGGKNWLDQGEIVVWNAGKGDVR